MFLRRNAPAKRAKMPPVGDPYVVPVSGGRAAQMTTRVRVARAANDNHPTHAAWRRVVAASMALLFAASLILVGLVCIARAGEFAPFIIGN
jgi:hypothetical protein